MLYHNMYGLLYILAQRFTLLLYRPIDRLPINNVNLCTQKFRRNSSGQPNAGGVRWVGQFRQLFHRRTRASYVYNVCLAWYNVVLTPRIHSSVKFVGLPLATRATVE